jgi:tetratricopeptide (TPR) repeat protein
MIRIFLRKTGWAFFVILVLSGCAVFPVRENAAPSLPAAAHSPSGAGYHYSLGILHALNENMDAAILEMEEALRIDPDSPYLAKELASIYMEKGDTEKAFAICKKTLEGHPDDSDTRLLLGGLYLNRKDYPGAAGEYRRVIELAPKNTAARFYLGMSLAEMKQFDEAAAAFRELLKIDPDHFMGNYYLARILSEMKRYDEAEAGFRTTLALRPKFESAMIDLAVLYERQQKIPQAVEVYRNFIDLFPARLQARIKLGELYLQEQRYDEAEKEFQEVLKLDGNNREVRMTLALIYLERGRHEKAVEMLDALMREYPTEYKITYLLGTTYEEIKAYDAALETLRGIPASSEYFGGAQIRIGMILNKQQRTTEAVDSLLQAIGKKKDAPGLYAFLASIYEEEKKYSAAEELIREGLRTSPGSVDLHFSLGVLFEKTDRFEESIQAMKTVLKLEPDHAEALNFIGYMYADRGIHLDEAEKLIRKALRLRPGNGYMIDSLGWVFFRNNRLEEAIRYLKEASEALPEDAAILEHLGDAYVRSGQSREAADAYEKAIRFNPVNNLLKKKRDDLHRMKTPLIPFSGGNKMPVKP